ncbi:spore maturation protein CgeB [Paenibacillus phyllosphaerae]|uniref:Spore maturation protein CgeB n=1 Tax=Paenibacillus phyllosphaerae TaxID=274593 RepID=A0A7W5B390_9BACL|nr:glycosyltransferase [Paenibacillus phyllosphaerae]MBB3113628.1 spore maturation protein CgeB [Paenibacillus phyllosphaerae]
MHPLKETIAQAARVGYEEGFKHGMRDGACQAVVQSVIQPPPVRRQVRVLFVPQGFDAIDEGITAALTAMVSELFIAHPTRMAEMAGLLRPDWLLVMNGLHVFPDDHLAQIDAIRALGTQTAIWFADDPYVSEDTKDIAPHYDVVFTHELGIIPFYQALGCKQVYNMPLAVNQERFKPRAVPSQYFSDVCFIGQAFWNRVELFDAAAARLAGRKVFIAGGLWDRMRNYKLLEPAIRHGWLPVDESINYYNGARIVINLHRGSKPGPDNRNAHQLPARSINPRTYEINACGTLQLTDVREDLPNYYRPGWELDTYNDAEELLAKIDYYLSHEDERRQIALRGLRRTITDHTFARRLDQIADMLGWQKVQP